MDDAHLREAAEDYEAVKLLNELRERLGPDALADPEHEITERGRLVIHAGGLSFFRDERDGAPAAYRTRGGRAEFAHVEPDGRMVWTFHPLAPLGAN